MSTNSFPWRIALPISALVIQIGVYFVLRGIVASTFGPSPTMDEALAAQLTNIALAIAGIVAGGLTIVGLYLLIAKSNAWLAIPVIVLICLPATLCACVSTYALLIFLCLV